jgi:transposase
VPSRGLGGDDRRPGPGYRWAACPVADLEQANARLIQANQVLAARMEELERRLGRDSSNSSRPPSSDGLGKPATPRRERRAGGRKPGKQPGAPGAHLARVADPDEIVVHVPDRCGGCGGELAGTPVTGIEVRQVFDLPPLGLRVTEHRGQRRRCACGQITTGAFPEQVCAPNQYGPGVRALGCYLLVQQHLPIDRAAKLLADVLGAPVATGTLAAVVAEGAAGLGEFATMVRAQLAAAPVAHFDETGARVAGRLHWVHSASTAELTWQTVHPKRGRVAMDAAGVLPSFRGVAVHDGWSPYRHYQATHALCGAHLLRELEATGDAPRQGWAAGMAELLCDAKLVADRARAAGWARVDAQAQARLHVRYARLLADGHAANRPRAGCAVDAGRGARRPARLLARLDAWSSCSRRSPGAGARWPAPRRS